MAFGFYKTFTTDHTQCGSADSTDFPVCINVTDADLKSVGNGGHVQSSSGFDIRPFSDSGLSSALTFELVFYDPTTGYLEMHVKVSTLSHTSDLVSYLAFGDASISTDGSSTGTWNSAYNAVYHLKDGTTLSLTDSTANAFNMTNFGSPGVSAVAGKIDGAGGFNGSTAYARVAQDVMGGVSNATYTIQAIVKSDVTDTNPHTIVEFGNTGTNTPLIILGTAFGSSTHKCAIDHRSGTSVENWADSTTSIDDGSWWWVAGTRGGPATFSMYVNGVLEGNANNSNTPGSTNVNRTSIGAIDRAIAILFWNGSIDEVRISNVARPTEWLLSEYNNQKPASTFLTWGSLTPVGGSSIRQLAILGVG